MLQLNALCADNSETQFGDFLIIVLPGHAFRDVGMKVKVERVDQRGSIIAEKQRPDNRIIIPFLLHPKPVCSFCNYLLKMSKKD